MKISIKDKTYYLNLPKAIELGVAVEDAPINLQLTHNEAVVLSRILDCVGGDPKGARGCCDNVSRKISKSIGGDRTTDLNLSLAPNFNGIVFKY